MLDTLLSLVAPHLCGSCGKIGTLLCDNCKYDITSEPTELCMACGGLSGVRGICGKCRVPYQRAWCVGRREDVLRKLVDDYKFENAYAAHRVLADLLSQRIGQLPPDVTVVAIPSIAAHIRRRGYDHAGVLAKRLARLQKVAYAPLLKRKTATRQRGATKSQRIRQAKEAFEVRDRLSGGIYLLVDDIVTTGATVKYAAQALRDAGASEVWVAVVARQTLD